jgi:hypothetical protein
MVLGHIVVDFRVRGIVNAGAPAGRRRRIGFA